MVEVKDHESGMVDSCPIIKAEGDEYGIYT